jgi:hypothetical protein
MHYYLPAGEGQWGVYYNSHCYRIFDDESKALWFTHYLNGGGGSWGDAQDLVGRLTYVEKQ